MLIEHDNFLVQLSDLLQVGQCRVDIPRRQVRSEKGSIQRINLKTLQVLLVLARHQGRVVSREALLEWVWPDTLPTDDVLTQAVAQLRKSFDDDRDAPRYIETIAKGGYRLIAPIVWVSDHEGASVAQDAPSHAAASVPLEAPPRDKHLRVRLFLIPAAVSSLIALGIWGFFGAAHKSRTGPAQQEMALATIGSVVERITSMPGSEMYPSLSPDGSQIVYSAYDIGGKRADLMVQTRAPVLGHVLVSAEPNVQNTLPAWSPDGRQIAFVRVGPKEQCEIRLVPATGGESRPLTACTAGWDAGVGWSPDSRHLVTTQNDGAIYTIDLASGQWKRLKYDKAASDIDGAPVYSPDGKWIAFHRNVSMSDIWRVPAAGGTAEQLTHLGTNIYRIAWSPDSRSLIFGRYRDGSTVLTQLFLADRTVRDLPAADAAYPTTALSAPVIAFMIMTGKSAIVSTGLLRPVDSARLLAAIFPSTGNELLPSISPDGKQIAFVSDRSGDPRVWVGTVGQPETLRLIDGIAPIPRYAPAWSPGSDTLLVIGRQVDQTLKDETSTGVFEVHVSSGIAARLTVPSAAPVYALYTQSDRIMVVADRGAGRLDLTLYQQLGTQMHALAALPDIAYALRDDARHRVLLTRPTQAGLWQADLELTRMSQLNDTLPIGAGRSLFVDKNGVAQIGSDDQCGLRQFFIAGRASIAGPCLQKQATTPLSVSFDQTLERLYISVQQPILSDLGWTKIPGGQQANIEAPPDHS